MTEIAAIVVVAWSLVSIVVALGIGATACARDRGRAARYAVAPLRHEPRDDKVRPAV